MALAYGVFETRNDDDKLTGQTLSLWGSSGRSGLTQTVIDLVRSARYIQGYGNEGVGNICPSGCVCAVGFEKSKKPPSDHEKNIKTRRDIMRKMEYRTKSSFGLDV